MAVAHPTLLCLVESLSYDFDQHLGKLELPANTAADAGGVWRLFEAIDPNVSFVEIYAGGRLTDMHKRSDAGWDATIIS